MNTFCAPPTAYRMLAHENFSKYDLASVRHSVSAGEPLVRLDFIYSLD